MDLTGQAKKPFMDGHYLTTMQLYFGLE